MTDLTNTELSLDNTTDTSAEQYDPAHDYHALNAMLNLYDADGKIQFDKDKAAEREYVTGHVAANSMRFDSTAERLDYLISNQYYNPDVFAQYSAEFLDRFYEHVESAGFEFGTFLGAFKFYTSYALKTFDGRLYLENFPQRCAAVALELAAGNEAQATEYADEMLAGRFQPATPTFLNLGKAQRGEPVSCFLVRIEDNMESISRGINAALQLSKRGGGVALLLSNLRELGAPIKRCRPRHLLQSVRSTSPRRWMAAWLTRWRRRSAHSPRWPSTPASTRCLRFAAPMRRATPSASAR